MKKLILLLSIVNIYILYASTNPIPSQEVSRWRNNFKNIHNPEWEKYQEVQNRQKILGYNPEITLTEKNHPDIIQESGPTLLVHGWIGSKDAYSFARLYKSNNIPGDVIAFNFQDASYWYKQTIPYWFPVTKSNFAGRPDILALLHTLKTIYDVQCSPAIIYPHSRGAGTTMAVIGILNNPTETEKQLLSEWNVTENDRINILQSIKIIYLLTPLTNIENAINRQLEKRLFFLFYSYLPKRTKQHIASFLKNNILPLLTKYDSQQKNPISYIEQWKNIKSCIWLHFEENDWDVSNEDDIKLTCMLRKLLPPGRLSVSCTNNGGHNAYQTLINQIISTFNQQNNCSYHSSPLPNNKAEEIIAYAKLPTESVIEQHLEAFSLKYTQHNFWHHRVTKKFMMILKISLFGWLLYYLNSTPYGIAGFHFTVNHQYFDIYKR